MQLKEILKITFYNLLLYDLDKEMFVEYSENYDDYYVIQVFADLINDELRTCIDITKEQH